MEKYINFNIGYKIKIKQNNNIAVIYHQEAKHNKENCIVSIIISKRLSSLYISIAYVKEIYPENYWLGFW